MVADPHTQLGAQFGTPGLMDRQFQPGILHPAGFPESSSSLSANALDNNLRHETARTCSLESLKEYLTRKMGRQLGLEYNLGGNVFPKTAGIVFFQRTWEELHGPDVDYTEDRPFGRSPVIDLSKLWSSPVPFFSHTPQTNAAILPPQRLVGNLMDSAFSNVFTTTYLISRAEADDLYLRLISPYGSSNNVHNSGLSLVYSILGFGFLTAAPSVQG